MSVAALEAGDLIQFRIWTTLAEQAAVNTVYYQCGIVTGTAPSLLVATQQFGLIVVGLLPDLLPDVVNFNGVQSAIVNDNPRTVGINEPIDAPGTAGSLALPRQSAGLISWRTAFSGPSGRGRMYLPFPPVDDDATIGLPSAAYKTAATAYANALRTLTSFAGLSGDVAVALTLAQYRKPIYVATNHITDFTVPLKWATIKRRGSYGRPNSSPIP